MSESNERERDLFADDINDVYNEETGNESESYTEAGPNSHMRVKIVERDPTITLHREERQGKSRKSKKNKKDDPQEESEFDRILKNAKQKRKRRQFTEEEASTRVQNFLLKMRDAADLDDQNIANGMPAVAKLSILDEVCTEIVKPAWTLWYLQEGLLGVLEKWLTALPDGSLPNLTLRTKVLSSLTKIHCSPDHVANTTLGERLLELWKNPEESEENRQHIRKIVSAIIRPILGLHYSAPQQLEITTEKVSMPQPQITLRSQFKAAVPRVEARTFRVAPKSQIQTDLLETKTRHPKRKATRTSGGYY